MEDSPVLVVDRKPLAITRADVDIDRAEVIVFLMSGSAGSRNLHVKLDRVHAKNRVANVREEVTLWTVHLGVTERDTEFIIKILNHTIEPCYRGTYERRTLSRVAATYNVEKCTKLSPM